MVDPNKRYKVRIPPSVSYEQARALLQDGAQLMVDNPRRRSLAATGISASCEKTLLNLGATFIEDAQYQLD